MTDTTIANVILKPNYLIIVETSWTMRYSIVSKVFESKIAGSPIKIFETALFPVAGSVEIIHGNTSSCGDNMKVTVEHAVLSNWDDENLAN